MEKDKETDEERVEITCQDRTAGQEENLTSAPANLSVVMNLHG